MSVEFVLRPCISFAIVMYHCSVPASGPRMISRPRRNHGLCCASAARFNLSNGTLPRRARGTRDYAIWKVCEINQLSIQLQNKSTGHPETRRLAISVKSKKRKTNPEVCFSKFAQFVTQKRKTATGEVTKQREEINI